MLHGGEDVEVGFDAGVARASVHVQSERDATRRADVARDEAAARLQPAVLTVTGRVAEIARATEAGAHAFLVKIDLPPDVQAPSGAFARARFAGPTRRVVALPRAAIIRRGQLTSAFAVDGEHARLRLVSVGEGVFSSGGTELVEVLAGVDAGDRVIVNPSPGLRDGVRVRAAGNPQASAALEQGAR
jgi:hypothetical protein